MESGAYNFNMHNALKYLSAIKATLSVNDSGTQTYISEYPQLVKWLLALRGDMTQSMLNDKLGLSNGTIGKIEAGKIKMSIDVFIALSDYFHTQIILSNE